MMIWKWLLRTVLTLVIIIMIMISFLLTPYGFKFTFYVAEKMLPGQLHYQTASGLLTGPITIRQLDYRDQGQHIHIDRLIFDWSPTALLHDKLKITEFNADGFTLITPHRQPSPSQPTTTSQKSLKDQFNEFLAHIKPFEPQPLTLPLSLEINHAKLSHVIIGNHENNPTTVIQFIDINGVIYPDDIHLTAKAALFKPRAIAATFTITGSLKHYLLNLTVKENNYQIDIHGDGNRNGMTINIPQGHALDGALTGRMKLSWYPQINWNITLNANHVNLRQINSKLPHDFNLDLNTQGRFIEQSPLFDLDSKLTSNQSVINLNIHHHKLWQAKWLINIPHLNHVLLGTSGMLKSQGQLTGQLSAPTTSGTLQAQALNLNGITAQKIDSHWQLFFSNSKLSDFHASAQQLQFNQFQFKSIALHLTGQLLKHNINFSASMGKHSVLLNLKAHYDNNIWQGVITQFTSQHNQFGNWKLKQPTAFYYSPQSIYLKPLCLNANSGAYLCTDFNWQADQPWQFDLDSKNFSFINLEKRAMINTQFTSKLSIQANATGVGTQIEKGHMAMQVSPGTLTYVLGTQLINTAIHKSTIDVDINKESGLTAKLDVNVADKDAIHAKVNIPDFTDSHIPIQSKKLQSHVTLLMHDFRFVTLFEHVLKVSLGRLSGQFDVTGTVGSPYLKGSAHLKIPNFEYTTAQVEAHDIDATLHADGNKLTYHLKGYAFNKAPITMDGETDLSHPDVITHFTITTKNGEIIRTNQMNVFADATLNFLLKPSQMDITGKVFVPKAALSFTSFSSTLEMPKSNVEYIGLPQSQPQPSSSHKINLHLDVTLGNDVWLTAFGMKAKLDGGIVMKMSPNQVTIANGQVRIDQGTFQAYGQYLTIAKGSSVSFIQSPISNPFIDARAYKNVNSTTEGFGHQLSDNKLLVGVHIHGTIRSMKFNLYSQPAGISQADMLSYLIFGYASNNNNGASMSVLMDAANAMIDSGGGLNQPVSLTDRIKKRLGIRQLGVRNETLVDAIGNPIQDQSSFVVGEQLTEKIYVEFSRGLIIPDNILTVEYKFNKHWKLQTQTGTGSDIGTGADILYTISTD